jgi:hypothetical protein
VLFLNPLRSRVVPEFASKTLGRMELSMDGTFQRCHGT